MRGRSKSTAKPKISMISGPMDAKHVGGVSITGNTGPGIDHYFPGNALGPDEFPSHTFVATGKIEVPKRSGTFAHTIRRPSMSLRGNATLSRSKSTAHDPEERKTSNEGKESHDSLARSDSVMSSHSLRMRSSIARLRGRVGLEKDRSTPAVNVPSAKVEANAWKAGKDSSPLRAQDSQVRDAIASSSYSTASDHMHMKPGANRYQPTTTSQWPLPTTHQSTQQHPKRKNTTTSKAPPRPRRADSGTAVTVRDAPSEQRPIPFQHIMAVQNLAERMKLYEETRDYWAYADHGLVNWTGRAAAPKPPTYHR
ncbi:hypothetical protein J1614_011241 [Plenodomus biglobosus]|nr:hypothetical protein J1614_011241 [Plenodomus biglobosus]